MSERQPRGGNPALALVERLVDVRAGEAIPLLLAFGYHFLLFCGYYAVRPLRDTFGIERGASALPYLYTGTALFSLLLHPLFTRAVSKWPRRKFIPWTYHFFAINLLGFFVLLSVVPSRPLFAIGAGEGAVQVGTTEAIGYLFYWWISVFNLFAVSVFWSFMTDIFTPEQGKRLFGFLVAPASLGGIVGGMLAWQMAESLGRYAMIVIAIGFLEVSVLFVWLLSRHEHGENPEQDDAVIGGGVWDGVARVFRSPYLAGIAALMLLLTIGNTYFAAQEASIVDAAIGDRDARTAFMGKREVYVNVASFIVQFLVVGRMMRYLGLTLTLVTLPAIFCVCFVALANLAGLERAGFDPLTVILASMVATRAGRYAVMRPAREALYTTVAREDKYKAKNFNDTFVYRGGDLVGIWSDASMRWLSLTGAGIAGVGVLVSLAMGGVAAGLGVASGRRSATRDRAPA